MFEELLRRASLTVETAATLLRKVTGSPWFNSVDLVVTFPAGATEITPLHGLGRAMNGAIIVAQENPTIVDFTVGFPTSATTVVIRAVGAAPLSDVTLKLRVY